MEYFIYIFIYYLAGISAGPCLPGATRLRGVVSQSPVTSLPVLQVLPIPGCQSASPSSLQLQVASYQPAGVKLTV